MRPKVCIAAYKSIASERLVITHVKAHL